MVDSLFSLSKMECCATPPIEICEIFCHLRSKGGDFPWRIWGRREKLVRWNISYNILESEKVNWDMYTWGIPDSIWRVICSCMETSVSLASCWIDSGILSGQGLKSLGWVNWEFTSLKLSKPPWELWSWTSWPPMSSNNRTFQSSRLKSGIGRCWGARRDCPRGALMVGVSKPPCVHVARRWVWVILWLYNDLWTFSFPPSIIWISNRGRAVSTIARARRWYQESSFSIPFCRSILNQYVHPLN